MIKLPSQRDVFRVRRGSWRKSADCERLFAICNKANCGTFEKYRSKSTRPLPVVVITPR